MENEKSTTTMNAQEFADLIVKATMNMDKRIVRLNILTHMAFTMGALSFGFCMANLYLRMT